MNVIGSYEELSDCVLFKMWLIMRKCLLNFQDMVVTIVTIVTIVSWKFGKVIKSGCWDIVYGDLQVPLNIMFVRMVFKNLNLAVCIFRCSSHVLQKVCMYFTYKVRYTNSSTEIPEFPIAPEIALELLMAANFLDC